MKFRRNVHLYRGSFDATPLATVFFLLVIFLTVSSRIYTPGVHIELPTVGGQFPGTDKQTATVAIDLNGRYFYQNQPIDRHELKLRLANVVSNSPAPPVLQIFADKASTHESLVTLYALAAEVGFREARTVNPTRYGEPAPKTANP